MSRYYSIEIDGGPTYTSYVNGSTDPNALQVLIDIPVAPFASPAEAGAFIKILGVPLSDVGQAKNLNFKNIKVYGGFQKGLPLANPAQAGLLVQGYIYQAFGNWIGVEQSIDLYVKAGPAPPNINQPSIPPNLVLNWPKGQPMSTAIQSALATAFPGFTTNININPNLKLLQDEPSYYSGLEEFCRYIKATSKAIINTATYPGVDVTVKGTVFNIFDNTPPADTSSMPGNTNVASPTKTVAFTDLIGQPTWIEAPFIQFKTMMRADFTIGDQTTMPQTLVTNSSQAQTSLINQRVAFQGKFQISSIHHIGDFRQATAEAWVTVFDAFPLQVEAA